MVPRVVSQGRKRNAQEAVMSDGRIGVPGNLIAGIVVGLLSIVSAVRADRMIFVEYYRHPGRPLLLGMVAMALGLSAILLGVSVRARSGVILIVLGTLGILLSTRVVAACGLITLFFGLGGPR